MHDFKMEAAIIFDPHLPDALRQALEYAGDDGFVASMPKLLHARANAAYDNEVWKITFFASNSEESVATTPHGHHVVVAVHGGGIFASPERFETTYRSGTARSNPMGFTGQYAAKITEREARDVLDGKLPDGADIPVFSFDELKRGISDLPRRYAIVLDFDMARKCKSGNETFDGLKEDPLMIVRAGGVEAAAAYLDKARDRQKSAVMGNWHPFNDIDPDQSQTRVLFLAGDEGAASTEARHDSANLRHERVGIGSTHFRIPIDPEVGLRGDASMINMARYVAVAPRNVATSLRYLDFGA